MNIRRIDPERDAAAIAEVYRPFVLSTDVTFEVIPPSAGEMADRLKVFTSIVPGFLMEDDNGAVAGYCYAHPWKSFSAYSTTFETTVYVAPSYARRGIGRALMGNLVGECRQHGALALIACITGGNQASIKLHEALGFTQASYFRRVGRKAGRLLDVVDYQLLL